MALLLRKQIRLNKLASDGGFALPTILITSIVMLTVLLVSVTSTTTVRTAIVNQHYAQLAQLAGEAGTAYANACLTANSGIPQWSATKPLMVNTDCSGNVTTTCAVGSTLPACAVDVDGNVRSSFSVGLPTLNSAGYALNIPSQGIVQILTTSTGSVWRTYNQSSVTPVAAMASQPKMLVWTRAQGVSNPSAWISASSSADGSTLLALGPTNEVSSNFGATWSAHNMSVGMGTVNATAVASDFSHVYVAMSGGLYMSTNSGATWNLAPVPTTYAWLSAASSADGMKVVASTNTFPSVYISTDAGATWASRNLSSSIVGVASSSNGNILLSGSTTGLYISTDSGTTWISHTMASGWYQALASSADGTKLFAGNYGGYIYRSTDSGVTWTVTTAPSAGWRTIDASSDGTKLIAGSVDHGVYVSTDSGSNWSACPSLDSNVPGVAISSDGSRLLAGSNSGALYIGVYH